MKKEKLEGFWAGNEASTQSALAGTKMSQSVKQLRAEQQAKFREGLDSQIEEQKLYRLGGNMTQAEKSLNRQDLLAYKHKDECNYAMLPGISPKKNFMDPEKYPEITKAKTKLTYHDKQERLKHYGFGVSGSQTMKGTMLGSGNPHTKSMAEVPRTPMLEQRSQLASQRQIVDPMRSGSRSYANIDTIPPIENQQAINDKPSSKRFIGS